MSTSSLRIAVVGTYRSGSTAIAGILHHLGVDMGCSSDSQYFEPKDLSEALRRWWSEPRLVRSHPVERQIEHLKGWVESKKNLLVGAKHPLMSLSAPQIERAWGVTTKFVWCKRPLEESIISLTRKGWWPDSERIQTKLDLAE